MNSARISYVLRPDATPEMEVSALANVFKFVLDCHTRKEAAPESRPDDTKLRLAKGVSHVDQRPG